MDEDPPTPARPTGRLIGKRRLEAPTAAAPKPPPACADSDTETWPLRPAPRRRRGPEKIPKKLGQYEVVGEIAKGGMGVVLRGYHPDLRREVAIKLLRNDLADDEALERFMREGMATARLRHPGIVAIHDVGTDHTGRTYLVMDYVEGQNLMELIDSGPIPYKRCAELLAKIARAVAHAHSQKILHRDLKPDNVLIDAKTQEPLLTDFGLAKTFGAQTCGVTSGIKLRARRDEPLDVQLTQEGDVMGTPLYMAPEQIDANRGKVSAGTDVYALGVMLYQCLTGRVPFLGETPSEIFVQILTQIPLQPRQLRPDIPADLQAVALCAMEKSPLARYRTASEMAADLERFLENKPVLGLTHRAPAQGLSLRPLLLAALLLAALAAFSFAPEALKVRARGALAVLTGEQVVAPRLPVTGVLSPSTLEHGDLDRARVNALLREGTASAYAEAATLLSESGAHDPATLLTLGDLHGFNHESEWAEPEVALASWTRAAEEGSTDAMLRLAEAYQDGVLTDQDDRTALKWLRAAAGAGNADAMFSLGDAFENGSLGAPTRPKRARMWYLRAAKEGQAGAKDRVAQMARDRG